MNLSNRLTFSIIFSVVLVALFALAATPALAITTVTAQVTEVVDPDDTAGSVEQGRKVVTIKYSENADPAPVIADFTTDGTEALTAAVEAATDTLSVALGGSNDTFTLTFLGPADGSSGPTIPNLKLPGYGAISELEADSAVDPFVAADAPVRSFDLEANTLAGKDTLLSQLIMLGMLMMLSEL